MVLQNLAGNTIYDKNWKKRALVIQFITEIVGFGGRFVRQCFVESIESEKVYFF